MLTPWLRFSWLKTVKRIRFREVRPGSLFECAFAPRSSADSDELARAIRDDVAREYETISPGSGASLAGYFLPVAVR